MGTRRPFPFFCDFQGELADAVRNGRRKEFAEAYQQRNDDVPDPLAGSRVPRHARLAGGSPASPCGRFELVKRLFAARKSFDRPAPAAS